MRTKNFFKAMTATVLAVAAFAFAGGTAKAGEQGGASTPSNVPNPVQQNMNFLQDIFGNAMGGGAGGGKPTGQASLKTVQRLLAKEREVRIWEKRGRIFLEGRVTSEQMRTRIDKLMQTFSNIVDLTEYQPDMDTFVADMELIKDKIEETLNKGYKLQQAFTPKQEVSVNIINDKIVVSGELNTEEDVQKALHIATIYNDSVVNNLSVSKQMIEVAAIFAKMNRSNSKSIGADGMQSAIVTLPVITSAATSGAAATRNPLDYFKNFKHTASAGTLTMAPSSDSGTSSLSIDFTKSFEKSAILARPHLATVNGQSAEFLAGGEKAIKTYTSNVSDVQYKQYGVILTTTPSLTTEGRIKLTIKLEFSVPEANGEDFVTFRHEGQAILSRAQGVVMSGLINEARSTGLSSTPFVGKVPILKFFFSKETGQKEMEDLVLLVIPRVPGIVNKAPYPQIQETGKTPEDAYWIHKPSYGRRLYERIKGKDFESWKDPAKVEISVEEPNFGQEEKEGDKSGQGEDAAADDAGEKAEKKDGISFMGAKPGIVVKQNTTELEKPRATSKAGKVAVPGIPPEEEK